MLGTDSNGLMRSNPGEGNVVYWAYGANMSAKKLSQRGIQPRFIGPAQLVDPPMCIAFRHRNGFATLIPVEHQALSDYAYEYPHGVLYSITPQDLAKLQQAEVGYFLQHLKVSTYTDWHGALDCGVGSCTQMDGIVAYVKEQSPAGVPENKPKMAGSVPDGHRQFSPVESTAGSKGKDEVFKLRLLQNTLKENGDCSQRTDPAREGSVVRSTGSEGCSQRTDPSGEGYVLQSTGPGNCSQRIHPAGKGSVLRSRGLIEAAEEDSQGKLPPKAVGNNRQRVGTEGARQGKCCQGGAPSVGNGRIVSAVAFYSRPTVILGTSLPPRERYLRLLQQGARDSNLAKEYVEWLEGLKSVPSGRMLGFEYQDTVQDRALLLMACVTAVGLVSYLFFIH
eukprot:jgi/Botrbrau1/21029/Bobra.0144s0041.1